MRVCLSTYGSRGDTEPFAALGAALFALGADAIVSAPGDREFVELIDRAGVPLAPAFMPVRDWIASAQKAPADIPTYAERMIGAQFDAIHAAARGCDAIVATGLTPSVAAARCVAEVLGLHYFHVTFCPLFLPSHRHSPYPYPTHPFPEDVTENGALWAHNVSVMNDLFGGAMGGLRARLGLPPVDNIREHVFTRRSLLASDAVLWPWEPTDLSDPVQTGAWVLPDARPLSPELEAFLAAGEPPVYVGFGSIAIPTARAAAQTAIAAIRAKDRRVVLARGWAEVGLAENGDDCLAVGDVNQQALFPRCAAVVHHGGAGTTHAAAIAGAPQAIVPQIVDQPFWAARVAALGIGAAHDGPAPSVDSLLPALDVALAQETRARAQAVAGHMRTDGAMAAARQIAGG